MLFRTSVEHAWQGLGLTGPVSVAPLLEAYAAPARTYHTLDHIEACLRLAGEFNHHDPRITLAICYHDVVYDTHSSESESLSAAWAARDLENAGATLADRDAVSRLILATAHRTTPQRNDEMILVDVDLSILGAPGNDYRHYLSAIRQEYAWVSEENFRTGRTKFLRGMLKREFIYSTPRMRVRFEEKARENLWRELATLEAT